MKRLSRIERRGLEIGICICRRFGQVIPKASKNAKAKGNKIRHLIRRRFIGEPKGEVSVDLCGDLEGKVKGKVSKGRYKVQEIFLELRNQGVSLVAFDL